MNRVNVLASAGDTDKIPKQARKILTAALALDPVGWLIRPGSQTGNYRLINHGDVTQSDECKVCIDIKTINRNPEYEKPFIRIESISLGSSVPRQNLDLSDLNFHITDVTDIITQTFDALKSISIIDHQMLDEIDGMIGRHEFKDDSENTPYKRLIKTALAPAIIQAARDPKGANHKYLVVSRKSHQSDWTFEYAMGGARPDIHDKYENLNIVPIGVSQGNLNTIYTHAPLITFSLESYDLMTALRCAGAFAQFTERYGSRSII